MKKVIKPSVSDPVNSVDLFDGDRVNEFGRMYCVSPALLDYQANAEWESYVKKENKKFLDSHIIVCGIPKP